MWLVNDNQQLAEFSWNTDPKVFFIGKLTFICDFKKIKVKKYHMLSDVLSYPLSWSNLAESGVTDQEDRYNSGYPSQQHQNTNADRWYDPSGRSINNLEILGSTNNQDLRTNEALEISHWPLQGNLFTTTETNYNPMMASNLAGHMTYGFGNGIWSDNSDRQRQYNPLGPIGLAPGHPRHSTPFSSPAPNIWPVNEEAQVAASTSRLSTHPYHQQSAVINANMASSGVWPQNLMSGTTLLQGPPPPPLPPQHQPPPPRYNLSNFDVSVSSIWNNRSVGTTVQAAPPTPTPAPLPYSGNRLQIWNGSSSLNMGYGHPPPSIDFHAPQIPLISERLPTNPSGNNISRVISFPNNNQYTPFTSESISDAAVRKREDDMIWKDPNGDVRKWQRDTGTTCWGDPNSSERQGCNIQRWSIPPEEEYELIERTDVAQGIDSDFYRLALNGSSIGRTFRCNGLEDVNRLTNDDKKESLKRRVVVLGWGANPTPLPSKRSINAAVKAVVATSFVTGPVKGWQTNPSHHEGFNSCWDDIQQNRKVNSDVPNSPNEKTKIRVLSNVIQDLNAQCFINGSSGSSLPIPQISRLLQTAIIRDYVSWSILSRRLSSESLLLINLILFRLYLLEQHERSLNDLVNESCGEAANTAPSVRALMNCQQRTEYDRLMMEIASLNTDILSYRDKLRHINGDFDRKSSLILNDVVSTTLPRLDGSLFDLPLQIDQQKTTFSVF
ncbi:unnamed protein product [Dracunculus medinensis]|uniref:RING-type domain-containing protein n=1 Tax=Dracunculus medinensis TaxID=318479 RepID=A0A158Q3I9_DRAME|nr:unnamed protein product [Dracunculus medinensis]